MNRIDPFADHRARLGREPSLQLLLDTSITRPSSKARSGSIEEICRPKRVSEFGEVASRDAEVLPC